MIVEVEDLEVHEMRIEILDAYNEITNLGQRPRY